MEKVGPLKEKWGVCWGNVGKDSWENLFDRENGGGKGGKGTIRKREDQGVRGVKNEQWPHKPSVKGTVERANESQTIPKGV